MKVWIVERCINYEGCEVFGVFSSEEKANTVKNFLCSVGDAWDGTYVTEHDIDELPERYRELIAVYTKR